MYKDAYLYSFSGDKLQVYLGWIDETNKDGDITVKFQSPKTKGKIIVSENEGEIRNNKLWLYKRHDLNAIKTFLAHSLKEAEKWETRLNKANNRINYLSNLVAVGEIVKKKKGGNKDGSSNEM